MSGKPRVGLYLGARRILKNPGYLEALQRAVGLNLVIVGFSGEVPPEVLAANPFDGQPPSQERILSLITRDIDGRPVVRKYDSAMRSLGPHSSPGGNDAELREAIRLAHSLGIEVWLLGGVWVSSDYDLLMYCPSNEAVNHWYETLFAHIAARYDADGLDCTHARYPMLSELPGVLTCACERCARTAASMGYDMGRMVNGWRTARQALQRLDARFVAELGRLSLGPFDYLQLLGLDQGLAQWFRFRSDLIVRNVAGFRRAVRAAARPGFTFGVDTYAASLSMFVGHDQTRWAEHSDFASPLISHVDIFVTKALVSWAQVLQGLVKDLSIADALRAVYRFTGYDSLALPDNVADFALGEPDGEFRHVPLVELLTLDMAKARLALPQGLPCYPIIQGGGEPHLWPREMVDRTMAAAKAYGHDGVIFQGTRFLVDYDWKE
jgi:hypothetical protein